MLGNLAGYGSDSDEEHRTATTQPSAGKTAETSAAGSNNGSTSHTAAGLSSKTVASGAKAAATLGIKRSTPAASPRPTPSSTSHSLSNSRQTSPEATRTSAPEAGDTGTEDAGQHDAVGEWPLARYGLSPPDPSLQPDPALQAKLTNFHALCAQGHDFNATLERNKSFRNPHILDSLVRFVSVNERGSNLPADEIWDQRRMMEQGNAKRLGEIQKQREKDREERQTRGPRRDKISFEQSSGGGGSSSRTDRERSRSPHRHKDRDYRYRR